ELAGIDEREEPLSLGGKCCSFLSAGQSGFVLSHRNAFPSFHAFLSFHLRREPTPWNGTKRIVPVWHRLATPGTSQIPTAMAWRCGDVAMLLSLATPVTPHPREEPLPSPGAAPQGKHAKKEVDQVCGIAYDTTMSGPQIVLDTSARVVALRSRRGAAHRLLRRIDSGKFEVNLSVPLLLEYGEVCKRLVGETPLTEQDDEAILHYLCRVAHHRTVCYLWRPFLKGP